MPKKVKAAISWLLAPKIGQMLAALPDKAIRIEAPTTIIAAV